jgi:ABC-2 type transport system ATP-binding protein
MGLDPVARRMLLEAMVHLTRRQDRTIFFSSHELSDIERVADWIAVLDHGNLRACCRVETFRNRISEVRLLFDKSPPLLPTIPGLLRATRRERELRLIIVQVNSSLEHQLGNLGARRVEVSSVSL